MDEQLQQLIELQKEQNELLKRHLWRLRFSLATLLVLTTVSCVALGVFTYWMQTRTLPIIAPTPFPRSSPYPRGPQVPTPIPDSPAYGRLLTAPGDVR